MKRTIITLVLVFTWVILISVGVLSLVNPDWADKYSTRGHSYEALMAKHYGDNYFKEGQMRLAIANYRKAVNIKPDYGDAYYGLGKSYYRTDRPQKALKHFREAIRYQTKKISQAYGKIASIFDRRGMYKETLKNLHKSAETAADPTRARYEIAEFYFNKKMLDSAIVYFRSSLKSLKDFKVAYKAAIIKSKRFHTKLHKGKDYIETIEKALQREVTDSMLEIYDEKMLKDERLEGPEAFEIYYSLGTVYATKGDYNKGLHFFTKAHNINPRNEKVKQAIRDLRKRKNRE